MPAFVSKFSPEQWAEARRLIAEGTSFSALAAKLGISATYLRHRARKEGWARPDGAPAPANRPKRWLASPATADIRRLLALRLYRLLELEICMMELCMKRRLDAQTADGTSVPVPITPEERDSFPPRSPTFQPAATMLPR